MVWKELREPSDDEAREIDLQYRGKARFLVDESVGPAVAEFVRSYGYNAKFVADVGLRGRSDEDVFAEAWKGSRIVLTHDADFLDDRRFPPHRNPGIIVIRPGASGRDDYGLLRCLSKAVIFGGKRASWFRGKKIDFTSDELLTITSQRTRNRYFWRKHRLPMISED